MVRNSTFASAAGPFAITFVAQAVARITHTCDPPLGGLDSALSGNPLQLLLRLSWPIPSPTTLRCIWISLAYSVAPRSVVSIKITFGLLSPAEVAAVLEIPVRLDSKAPDRDEDSESISEGKVAFIVDGDRARWSTGSA